MISACFLPKAQRYGVGEFEAAGSRLADRIRAVMMSGPQLPRHW